MNTLPGALVCFSGQYPSHAILDIGSKRTLMYATLQHDLRLNACPAEATSKHNDPNGPV